MTLDQHQPAAARARRPRDGDGKAERQRARRAAATKRYRRRLRDGRMGVWIEIGTAEVDALARLDWLSPRGDVVERDEISSAIERLLEDIARRS
jgi:hypothetical protein